MLLQNLEWSLRALVRRTPFRPFTVELVSGPRIKVDHPEALVFRKGMAVFISARGVPILFDHESVSQVIWKHRPSSFRLNIDQERPVLSGADLAGSELIGIWADRTDIVDSQEFARQLRLQAEHRQGTTNAARH
jgi:hypothetical protein